MGSILACFSFFIPDCLFAGSLQSPHCSFHLAYTQFESYIRKEEGRKIGSTTETIILQERRNSLFNNFQLGVQQRLYIFLETLYFGQNSSKLLECNLKSSASPRNKYKNQMNSYLLIALLLATLFAASTQHLQTNVDFNGSLCTPKLFKLLRRPRFRSLNPAFTHLDLFRTMQNTEFVNADKVLERIARYDPSSIEIFLNLTTDSYKFEQAYSTLSDESILSFSYEDSCQDICTTYSGFDLTAKDFGTVKPLTTNLTLFECDFPDNRLCRRALNKQRNSDLFDQLIAYPVIQDREGNLLYYKRFPEVNKIEYCFTVDASTMTVTHICAKYEQVILGRQGPIRTAQDAFSPIMYERLITLPVEEQEVFNYILSKFKFGEQLGRIYADCQGLIAK